MTDDKEILQEALERFKAASEAEASNRRAALDDLRFAMGEQWDDATLQARKKDGNRLCLTINRVQQMVKQVVNDIRQNRPAIKVHPVDSGADVEVAEVMSGMIRHIEVSSCANDAYDYAAECAVIGGFGYFRIVTEYEDESSFDLCIRIERIRNPFTVYFDPHALRADGEDASFAFVVEELTRKEFERQYPKAKMASYEDQGIGDSSRADWIGDETIRVAEYFVREAVTDTLYLMEDGSTVLGSDLEGPPPAALKTREVIRYQVKWYKLTGAEVLEKNDWPGTMIPIIPVWGEEYDIEGEVHRMGIVRHAKDAQRIYNFERTAAVEQVALAPKAPFVIAEGQVEGYEGLWAEANVKSHAFLPYKPTTVAGVAVPPPKRMGYEGTPTGVMTNLQLAAEEIKAVTGIYDAALGNRSNETSGKAIMARQREADNATFHFTDNLARAIRLCGRQLVELIPIIYDTRRQVRIVGVDGSEKMTEVNAVDPLTNARVNPLDVGRYDVTVDVGPSYQTKRIEAANSMIEFMQAVPNAAPLIGDLIAKNMDWPGGEEIAQRLKVMLPPQVQQSEEQEGIPLAAQAKMTEMQQVIQGLQEHMQQAMQTIEQQQKALDEKQGQMAVDAADVRAKVESERIKAEAEVVKAQLEHDARMAEIAVQANKPECGDDGKESAALAALQQSMMAISQQLAMLGAAPKEPVVVNVGGTVRKKGVAVKQPDGSWLMESVETEVDE